MVTKGHSEDIVALRSNHEEADTRLLLHAKHAYHSHTRIVIDCLHELAREQFV